jgi:PKD repeat protein
MKRTISILSLGLIAMLVVLVGCDPLDTLDEFENELPTADAGGDQTVILGATVELNGSNSSDPENYPLSYLWEITSQPGASTVELDNTTVFFTSFVPDVEGVYTVRLTIEDEFDTVADDVIIRVEASAANEVPTVDFVLGAGTDTSGTEGDSFSFTVSASDDDGTVDSYDWDFGDGTTDSTLVDTTTHTFTSAGVYTVEVTVTDDDGGQAVASIDVTVNAPAVDPVPVASFAANVKVVDLISGPGTVNFTDYSSNLVDDTGAGDVASYDWDFGGTGASPLTATTQGNTSATYSAVGSYTVTLTVTDNAGQESSDSLTIKVVDTSATIETVEWTPSQDVTVTDRGEVINDNLLFTGTYRDQKFGSLFVYDIRPAIEEGWKIQTATLYLDYFGSEGVIDRIDLQLHVIDLANNWSETKPSSYEETFGTSQPFGEKIVLTKLGTYQIDVTEVLYYWLDKGEFRGLALEPLGQFPKDTLAQFNSSESKTPGLRLEIEYSLP